MEVIKVKDRQLNDLQKSIVTLQILAKIGFGLKITNTQNDITSFR